MINLKLLRYLQEVARTGSIRKAATLLNISSSALNRQILALESQLGTSLFERLPKRLRLTAAGEVLMDYAQVMAKENSRALGRIAALHGTQQGQVRIASMGGLINGPMLKLATDFIEQRNRVLVKIEIMAGADAIAARVLSGESDLGLGYNIVPNPALRILHSVEVEIGAVMGAKHPLRKRKELKLAHCLDYPIATGSTTTAIRSLVDHAFLSADLPLQPSIETDSIEVMKQAAGDGRCITFLNPLDISAESARRELVCVRLHEKHFPRPSLYLVVRARGALEATASRLAEELRRSMAENSTNTYTAKEKQSEKAAAKQSFTG